MISRIRGKVVSFVSGTKFNVVEISISSGLTYEIFVPVNYNFDIGLDILLSTYLYVREDMWNLYGFMDHEQKEIFSKLINVSGIGPKVAIAILGTYKLDELRDIIAQSDITRLSKVSGLGNKGAKKIILELQGELVDDSQSEKDLSGNQLYKELKEVLMKLGFSGDDLKRLLKKGENLLHNNDKSIDGIEDLVAKVLEE